MKFILFVILVIVVILFILKGFYIVQQQQEYIIERFGKFKKITGAGFHVKIPFIDRIVARIPLRTMKEEFNIDAKTKDNVTISMTISAQYHVEYTREDGDITQHGVYKAFYALANPVSQMRDFISDALRSAIPKYTLDEVFDRKDAIANDVKATVSESMNGYGYVVVNTLITAIGLPREVEDSMNHINSAQREREAAQALADADKIKLVTDAQAKAEAMAKAGNGIAAQRLAIAKGIANSLDTIQQSGVSNAEANQLFLYTQWVDMMSDFAKAGKTATVVLPNNFQQSMSMFEQMFVSNAASDAAADARGEKA